MLEVGSFQDPGTKDKWLPIVTMDFMSSDESASDEGKEVLLTKPLQWESLCVAEFKRSLDDAAIEQKSPLATRQMKPRRSQERGVYLLIGRNLAETIQHGPFWLITRRL